MESETISEKLQVWGGIECTINRVKDEYKDQLKYSGHYHRAGDIDAFADLGVKYLRYPILWEKHQPDKNQTVHWQWTDRQLNSIRNAAMEPIAGLLHHGSGPEFTHLLDPAFPYLLAEYAYEVACRYPWIKYYTPVNEPLTTARFSGLYGLWYPHHENDLSFYRMLLHQLKGVVLSMEAIRSINPGAKLIQTEDLGKTHSTELLSYQAEFENTRRLLTFDILTGNLRPEHPQFQYILNCGIREDELQFFLDRPVHPDIIGLNYYVTSERWLDEHVEKYDVNTQGGNGRHQYADTELVRVHPSRREGLSSLAREIWSRYQIPLAVTEAHLHCTREEQLRWFKEIWDEAVHLLKEGVNIKAVTAWALLGSFDWDSLLTKTGTLYESGVFDIKTFSGELRPTALATLIRQISDGRTDYHPVLSSTGWWNTSFHTEENMNRRLIILLKSNIESEEKKNLAAAFRIACQQRNIHASVIILHDELFQRDQNAWAVIDLANESEHLKSYCAKYNMQYVAINSREVVDFGLHIIAEETAMTIHQINKVLDLMIDGDQGCWIFDSDEVTFKRPRYAETVQLTDDSG